MDAFSVREFPGMKTRLVIATFVLCIRVRTTTNLGTDKRFRPPRAAREDSNSEAGRSIRLWLWNVLLEGSQAGIDRSNNQIDHHGRVNFETERRLDNEGHPP